MRPWAIDALIAFGLPLFRLADPLPDDTARAAAVLAVPLLGCLPLLLRRSHPWLVLFAVSAGHVASELNDPEFHVRGLALGFACYAVARYAAVPRSLAAVGVTPAVLAAPGFGEPFDLVTLGVATVAAGVVWAIGASLRRIHADGARLRELAARLRAEQELSARRAVASERVRIAHELHDLVAGQVSAIAMLARATEDDPTLAGERMRGIGDTADVALTELRRLLRLLADGDGPPPEPSLDQLPRVAGEHVEITASGPDIAIPRAVQVSAYRIVHEAITNVRKHAGAAATRVHLRRAADSLTITVENDPPVPGHTSTGGTGLGLMSMRERTTLFDGELTAGPTADGGWQVRATLRFPT